MLLETYALPAFIAGILMFLAPCTLPLVPGFLAFIAGGAEKTHSHKRAIFFNALWYVAGFSIIFILLGTAISFIGSTLRLDQRAIISQIGGVLVFFFGFFLIFGSKLSFFKFLNSERSFHLKHLHPGTPVSSFLFGAIFAFGWTPCIGPILGSILTFASTASTAFEGTVLLAIFSAGMGLPFLLLAYSIETAQKKLKTIYRYLPFISKVGGILLMILGFFMAINKVGEWNQFFYQFFSFIEYDQLLNSL